MRLLLIDSHLDSSELYQELTKNDFTIDVIGDEHEATDFVRTKSVDLIIIKYFLAEITGVKLAAYFRRTYPFIPVVIVSEEPSLEKWKEATQVKATFMPLPIDITKLKQLFTKKSEVKSSSNTRKSESSKLNVEAASNVLATMEEVEPEQVDIDEKKDSSVDASEVISSNASNPDFKKELNHKRSNKNAQRKQKKHRRKEVYDEQATVITIFSPKGGVGKTTTAVNLATLFKTDLELETVILEFTRQTGNVLGHFPLNPNINIRDWVERSQWPTEEELEDMLLWCPTTGVAILPTQPLLDEDVNKAIITPEDVSAIIDCLATHFDCIVIDGGTVMDDVLFHLLDISDQVVMVSKIERETLQDCHYIPIMLERRDIDDSKVVHLLNQAKKGLGMSEDDALGIVGLDRNHVIHFEKDIEKIPIEKEPFIIRKKKGRYHDELWELASVLVEHPEFYDEPKRTNMLDKFNFWRRSS